MKKTSAYRFTKFALLAGEEAILGLFQTESMERFYLLLEPDAKKEVPEGVTRYRVLPAVETPLTRAVPLKSLRHAGNPVQHIELDTTYRQVKMVLKGTGVWLNYQVAETTPEAQPEGLSLKVFDLSQDYVLLGVEI